VLLKKVADVATIIDCETLHTDLFQAHFTLRQILKSIVFVKTTATTSTAARHSNGCTVILAGIFGFLDDTFNDRVRIGAFTVHAVHFFQQGRRRGQDQLSNRCSHALLRRKGRWDHTNVATLKLGLPTSITHPIMTATTMSELMVWNVAWALAKASTPHIWWAFLRRWNFFNWYLSLAPTNSRKVTKKLCIAQHGLRVGGFVV
jgi:hypothetical protein